MDDIISGAFSRGMMEDWTNDDHDLLTWRAATAATAFEKTQAQNATWPEQTYFDRGILMMAFVKAGVELAFETMVSAGIIQESAYYESLHELPLIANTVARKKLYEMNRIISDTAEYGCYLFDHAAKPLLTDFMKTQVVPEDVGLGHYGHDIENKALIQVNQEIAEHPIEHVGKRLRLAMTAMKTLNTK